VSYQHMSKPLAVLDHRLQNVAPRLLSYGQMLKVSIHWDHKGIRAVYIQDRHKQHYLYQKIPFSDCYQWPNQLYKPYVHIAFFVLLSFVRVAGLSAIRNGWSNRSDHSFRMDIYRFYSTYY